MRKEILILKNGIIFGLGFFLIISILGLSSYLFIKAWNATDPNDLQSTAGDKLSSSKFNGLLTRTKTNYIKNAFTNGDVSLPSAVNTDAGISLSLTTSTNPVLISVRGGIAGGAAADTFVCAVFMDGVDQSSKGGFFRQSITAGRANMINIDFITDALTAGSHTFGLKCKPGGTTMTLSKNTTRPLYYSVTEIKQ